MGGQRIGRTADGRFVPIDHPEAAFLAYSEHDEVPPEVAEKMRAPARDKQAAKPQDKAVKKAAKRPMKPKAEGPSTAEAADDGPGR
jgi:hypothetical protein